MIQRWIFLILCVFPSFLSACQPLSQAKLDQAKALFLDQGATSEVISQFRYIVENYPKSPEAPLAKGYLRCTQVMSKPSFADWTNYLENDPIGVCREQAEEWLENYRRLDLEACHQARRSGTMEAWRIYLATFYTGACGDEARTFLHDSVTCMEAKKKDDYGSWKAYLDAYPTGLCRAEAENAVAERRKLSGLDIQKILTSAIKASKGCESKKRDWYRLFLSEGGSKLGFENTWRLAYGTKEMLDIIPQQNQPLALIVNASVSGFHDTFKENVSAWKDNPSVVEACHEALQDGIQFKLYGHCISSDQKSPDWVSIQKQVMEACGKRGLK